LGGKWVLKVSAGRKCWKRDRGNRRAQDFCRRGEVAGVPESDEGTMNVRIVKEELSENGEKVGWATGVGTGT